jgi:hypothetical protein
MTPQETQRQQQHNIKPTMEPVIVPTISRLVKNDILPRDYEEQVEVEPPEEQ